MLQPCHELFRLPLILAAAPETHRSLQGTMGDDGAMSRGVHPWKWIYTYNNGI